MKRARAGDMQAESRPSRTLWLFRSTALLRNRSAVPLLDTRVTVGATILPLGVIKAGVSRFFFLPRGGDATFSMTFTSSLGHRRLCQEYVEGDMYHVDVLIGPDLEGECSTDLPLFSQLLLARLL